VNALRCAALLLGLSALVAARPIMIPPDRDYLVYVASESADRVALVRFGPKGISIERQRYVGSIPSELAGPHGVSVSPDGKHYFVTTAHGMPFGYLQKYSTATDSVEGNVALGNFPATVQVSPNGFYVFVSNFNLHGDMVPSSVSVVGADEMVEIARIETCTMPHGSRLTADGRHHYSTCMMDEALVEIDTRTMAVSRHFIVTAGHEVGKIGSPVASTTMSHDGSQDMSHGADAPKPGDTSCQPTWAQPSADGSRIWVACNKSSEIVEIDGVAWRLLRRIPARPGVYNLAVTHDGRRLLATNKRDQSFSVIDIASGNEVARIPTTRKVVNGVAVSDDDRYAFVSIEGSGAQPGTMDVIDLTSLTKVASIDLGQQAGGIDFWKSERVK
jgi:DNA-binding beta-propeller fold protein YncE